MIAMVTKLKPEGVEEPEEASFEKDNVLPLGAGPLSVAGLKYDPEQPDVDYFSSSASVASASVGGATKDDREALDNWLAQNNPRDYTAWIKTNNPLDPDTDWVVIGGKPYEAPQRMKRIRMVNPGQRGNDRVSYGLRREKTMTPAAWVERPVVPVHSWDEVGLARAKKAAARKERAMREARKSLGKSQIEPPVVPDVYVRRPPSVLWFVNHPDGCGIEGECWETGDLCSYAPADLRRHNLEAAEVMNNLIVEFFSTWALATDGKRDNLEEYKQELISSEPHYTEDKPKEEPECPVEVSESQMVEEVILGPLVYGPLTLEDHKIVQRAYEVEKMVILESVLNGSLEYDIEAHILESFLNGELEALEGEYIPAEESDPVVVPELTYEEVQLRLLWNQMERTQQAKRDSNSIEEVYRASGLWMYGKYPVSLDEVAQKVDREITVFIPGAYMNLPVNVNGLQKLREVCVEHKELTDSLVNKYLAMKVELFGMKSWLEPDAEMNMDGLLDDNEITMTIAQEDRYQSQSEWVQYKEDLRIRTNRGLFLQRCRQIDAKLLKTRARRTKMMWNDVRMAKRAKAKELRCRSWAYLVMRGVFKNHPKRIERRSSYYSYQMMMEDKTSVERFNRRVWRERFITENWIFAPTTLSRSKEALARVVNVVAKWLPEPKVVPLEAESSSKLSEVTEYSPLAVPDEEEIPKMVLTDIFLAPDDARRIEERMAEYEAVKPQPQTVIPISGVKLTTGDYETRLGELMRHYHTAHPRDEPADEPSEDEGRIILPTMNPSYEERNTRRILTRDTGPIRSMAEVAKDWVKQGNRTRLPEWGPTRKAG